MSKNEELRVEIIQFHHDMLTARHGGRQKIIKLVTRNYQWPGMIKNVEKYIDGYDMCQRIKNHIEVLEEKLMTNKVQEKPQTYLIVDFITKLPLVVGKDIILVAYNRLSKIAHLVAHNRLSKIAHLVAHNRLSKIAHLVATTEGTLAERLARKKV